MSEEAEDWRAANRANWDERVAVHLGAPSYDLAPLRAGRGCLHAIEAAELPPVAGLRVLHLQCHFGRDSLILAQQGAEVSVSLRNGQTIRHRLDNVIAATPTSLSTLTAAVRI